MIKRLTYQNAKIHKLCVSYNSFKIHEEKIDRREIIAVILGYFIIPLNN